MVCQAAGESGSNSFFFANEFKNSLLFFAVLQKCFPVKELGKLQDNDGARKQKKRRGEEKREGERREEEIILDLYKNLVSSNPMAG